MAGDALERLDRIAHRLRRECPWDREQDARSIVPHTVEEGYELADAAARDDTAAMRDELGDVLFQVVFLALLLEERGEGDLAAVADGCTEKLIRRHPHVFGEADAETSGEVLANWDRIKRTEEGREPGLFADVPENLPALLLARKLQRRAGTEATAAEAAPAVREAADRLVTVAASGSSGAPTATDAERAATEEAVGELLFAAVAAARALRVDPELALRAASERFREQAQADSRPPG